MDFTPPDDVAQRIRAQIDHPVVDGDGHLVEVIPLIIELIGDIGGPGRSKGIHRLPRNDVRRRLRLLRRTSVRQPFWGSPGPTVDRLTTALPALMYERLVEFGIDFAVLFTGVGLSPHVLR